eukprot:TRINITY_DN93225_c0_g1_i1.p1 TRINITY_DN93225_c0_g1~~TRINITY_DN93225_c0_g1_i1.p1  ORF type:complete len:707 (-),score=134.49 TRINITY_DN93225_c0_g1_i1:64-2184(-)
MSGEVLVKPEDGEGAEQSAPVPPPPSAEIGPAPDLDSNNFAKLNTLLDKTQAYSNFIKSNLPTSDAQPGEKRKREEEEFTKPRNMKYGDLRPYQLAGISWLVSLYKNGVNGILADEMGLGKTIMTIGLLSHLWEKKVFGPFLIVAPVSTLANWQAELARWAPEIPAVLYHGPKDERTATKEKLAASWKKKATAENGGVVITSFDIARIDVRFLMGFKWKYLVVDEAHRLKNFECQLIKELKRLSTSNRLLLTGTPLQNNLSELWSLLNFIMPEIFDELESFKSWFDFDEMNRDDDEEKKRRILHSEQQNQIITKLHEILRPFMLRRLKKDAGIDLPQKREVMLYCDTTARQMERYEAIRTRNLEAYLKEQKEKGAATTTATSVLNTLMQLRKICNHPFLFQEFNPFLTRFETKKVVHEIWEEFDLGDRKPYRQKRKVEETVTKEVSSFDIANPQDRERYATALIEECGKFKLLHKMLPQLREKGHKVLLFSQMTTLLDLLEDYLEINGYKWCRIDGSIAQKERQARIESFNTDPDLFLFLLSTRAGGLGINLTSADTVIIYDSDWNPQADLQAQDRCHRIGQTRPVCVYRLVTANTVESYLLKKATRKQRLENLVIGKGRFQSREAANRKLDLKDLEEALSLQSASVFGHDNAISDELLAKLLQRDYVMSLLETTNTSEVEKPEGQADVAGTGAGFELVEEVESAF